MSCFTILKEASAEFEEKKSIFIGHVQRVSNEEEARSFINKVKCENKEARHNVYAYVIGENMGIQRYSDDGEPQRTGGIPVLEVIKKNGVTDVVVVVTRYFGGILLGTGGLCRAYSKGAALAVKEGGIVEKVSGCALIIHIEYDMMGKVQYSLEQNNIHIENIDFTDKVKIKIFIEAKEVDKIKNKVIEITSANCKLEIKEENMYYKLENRLFNK